MKYLIPPLLLTLSLAAAGDDNTTATADNIFFCTYDKSWTFIPTLARDKPNQLPFVPDARKEPLVVGFDADAEKVYWRGKWSRYQVIPGNGLLFFAETSPQGKEDEQHFYTVNVSLEKDGMTTIHTSMGSIHGTLLGRCLK